MAHPTDRARILTCYYRPKSGGLCHRLVRTMQALLARGHDIHYVAVEPFSIEHANCHFHRFPWRGNTDRLLFWAWFVVAAPILLLIIGIRHRITHAFAFSHTYSAILQPLRVLRRIPLSLYVRADAIENHRISGRHSTILNIDSVIEGIGIHSVRLFPVSDALKERIVARHSRFHASHAATLPNNIEIRPRLPKTTDARLRLSCVGVLERRKNQAIAIHCVSRLRSDRVHLSIFGVGPDEAKLRALAHELDVLQYVTFRGWVPGDVIWSETDLLLFPSLHEGSPNSVLEAISHHVAVLASDIAEHREILPAQGLITANDAYLWGKAISHLIATPAALGALADSQEEFSKRLVFDWDKQICEMILA